MMVIDGDGAVLGRLSARIAKRLLMGEEVHLVNAEKVVISGKKECIQEKYTARRMVKDKRNPEHSPLWPRVPNMLVRRVIRGMLPYDRKRGREAYKRLRVYNGVPERFGKAKKESYPGTMVKKLPKKMTVYDLCKLLGYGG
jgi:large subunit ribosomal protein L13